MTNFPDYLTEKEKEFWCNLDELQVMDCPDSQIYSVTFAPNKRESEYNAIVFFRYSSEDEWTHSWVNEDGSQSEGKIPYIIRKPKEVLYTLEDILEINNHWFRAKGGGGNFYRLAWINPRTVCIGLIDFGAMSLDKLVEYYEHSPNGKDWYPLTKKV